MRHIYHYCLTEINKRERPLLRTRARCRWGSATSSCRSIYCDRAGPGRWYASITINDEQERFTPGRSRVPPGAERTFAGRTHERHRRVWRLAHRRRGRDARFQHRDTPARPPGNRTRSSSRTPRVRHLAAGRTTHGPRVRRPVRPAVRRHGPIRSRGQLDYPPDTVHGVPAHRRGADPACIPVAVSTGDASTRGGLRSGGPVFDSGPEVPRAMGAGDIGTGVVLQPGDTSV